MSLIDCLKSTFNFILLVSSLWMVGDLVLDVRQTSTYYHLSPFLNPNHEANLNMSIRLLTFCTELEKVEFDKSRLNETQKNFHDEWKEKCQNNDVNELSKVSI